MFSSSDNYLEGSQTEAIIKFCRVINPFSAAFHPTELVTLLDKKASVRGNKPPELLTARSIEKVLEESYAKALARHMQENPTGPAPKKIACQKFWQTQGYMLRWITSGGADIRLYIASVSRKKHVLASPPLLTISGWNAHSVRKYALLAGLKEPTLAIPKSPVRTETLLGMTDMARYANVPSFRNIRVPLGEFLDLLLKYR